MNSNSGVYVIFKVNGELGRTHYFPVNLLRLRKAFFDEVFLIQKIFEYHNHTLCTSVPQQRIPIFSIGNCLFQFLEHGVHILNIL